MSDQANDIPEQHHGTRKDIRHSFMAADIDEAEEMFLIAKDRLLDVSNWDNIASGPCAKFDLTDTQGHDMHRKAHQGDYVKINIGAPGPAAGDGRDWVQVESIVYDDYPDEGGESIRLQLRPCPSPLGEGIDTAHFFSAESTSTFVIERHGKLILAHYHGRNEVINNETDKVLDNIRNTAVAAGALLGLSDIQWDNLVKGFLLFDEE